MGESDTVRHYKYGMSKEDGLIIGQLLIWHHAVKRGYHCKHVKGERERERVWTMILALAGGPGLEQGKPECAFDETSHTRQELKASAHHIQQAQKGCMSCAVGKEQARVKHPTKTPCQI